MTKEELKQKVCDVIESRKEELFAIGQDIFSHPELGYKEFRTSKIVQEHFDKLGLSYEKDLAITGVKARVKGRKSLFNLGVMGELDSVLCPGHPHADPLTGAAHSCGHHAQITMMLGVAYGLVESGAMQLLDGDVSLMAVPAEEYVEIEYRNKLRKEGKVSFLGGKQEFIKLGVMDDVDANMIVHSSTNRNGKPTVSVGGTSNGFIGKFIKYVGKEAHSGGAPHDGINALNAALLGLMGIHLQRETLKDEDTIRIHPIMTKGGNLVNVIPADVRLETYVRGKSMPAVIDAAAKVDRALKAGAAAIGAEVEIETLPGYLPNSNEETMGELFRENVLNFVDEDCIVAPGHGTSSTDEGDISAIMPSLHPSAGGIEGTFHSEDFRVVDPDATYIIGAKAMAMTAVDMLWDGAKIALEIKKNFKPLYTKEAYLAMWDELLK